MKGLNDLPWKKVQYKNEAYNGAQIVEHDKIPLQILYSFLYKKHKIIDGYHYYLTPIREDLIRSKHKIEWRKRRFWSIMDEFVIRTHMSEQPPACAFCGQEFMQTYFHGVSSYTVNVYYDHGKVSYVCDVCNEFYLKTVPQLTERYNGKILQEVLQKK
jgi:hypothetical protein